MTNNVTVLDGRLGQEPELRVTQSGVKVATYTLAVTRQMAKDKENQITDWFNIVSWGDQADLVVNNLHKGTRVILLGKFQTRSYDNKEGKKVTVTEFMQDVMGIVPKKTEALNETGSTFDELPF